MKPTKIDYAATGVNSAYNRTTVNLLEVTGVKLNHIPYGSTDPLSDVVGGTVPLMCSGLPGALAHIQSGELVALAVSSPKHHPSLPNVPSVGEHPGSMR